MDNKASITALMSSFGRAFHAENEDYPVFTDHLAKELMTAEEYTAVQGYVLGGAQFFEPEIDPAKQEPKELLRRLVNVHIAPSPLCRAAYTEKALKAAVLTGTKQYVMLGAGMDTFAFREPEFLSKYNVFEVDHPLTQADKSNITEADCDSFMYAVDPEMGMPGGFTIEGGVYTLSQKPGLGLDLDF